MAWYQITWAIKDRSWQAVQGGNWEDDKQVRAYADARLVSDAQLVAIGFDEVLSIETSDGRDILKG